MFPKKRGDVFFLQNLWHLEDVILPPTGAYRLAFISDPNTFSLIFTSRILISLYSVTFLSSTQLIVQFNFVSRLVLCSALNVGLPTFPNSPWKVNIPSIGFNLWFDCLSLRSLVYLSQFDLFQYITLEWINRLVSFVTVCSSFRCLCLIVFIKAFQDFPAL